ncbi:MAG: DUF1353 domain-containing protein [Hyphomonas sp.]|jgi:hypothetical protein|uniref:DUF1353 domain-containing protein n=1 Tax=Hyphomonas sp. TaxID=87 RepID=UPI0037BFCC8D|nr:DUF1353 domain-containing protein [Hyphomonas sp.]
MPFIDRSAGTERLEALGEEGLEAVRRATHVGKNEARRHMVAVAILSDMEKQGRTLAVVTRPYAYVHPVHGVDVTVEVPLGFVTDFASIPSIFHFIVQPFGRHAPAAVLHDYLYAIGQKKARRLADRLFLNAMKDAGVPGFRRSVMYRMVRLFGGGGYGLKDDWKFVDAESGDPVDPPYGSTDISWAPPKPKRGKTASV